MPLSSETTDWYDFHTDPIYKVHGGPSSLGDDWNKTADTRTDGLTPLVSPCLLIESYNAHSEIARALGGDYPLGYPNVSGGSGCGWRWARVGLFINDVGWTGICFDVNDGPDPSRGSDWGSEMLVRSDIDLGPGTLLPQTVDAFGTIGGFEFRPWNLYSEYTNQWMDDDALADEIVAIEFPEGPGWSIEWEAQHPIFVGLEYAPDEPTHLSGTESPFPSHQRDRTLRWLENGEFWNLLDYDGIDTTWGYGLPSNGDIRAEYDGGDAPWVSAPAHWYPTQNDDPFDGSFVEGGAEDVVLLTAASSDIYIFTTYDADPGETIRHGRMNQDLAFRVRWRTPQYRFHREQPYVLAGPPAERQHFEPIPPP